jgi:hypothetical protein
LGRQRIDEGGTKVGEVFAIRLKEDEGVVEALNDLFRIIRKESLTEALEMLVKEDRLVLG